MQVNYIPMLVTEDLHFDVFGMRNVLFEEHRRVAKGPFGFAPRFVEQMPMAGGQLFVPGELLSAAEIRRLVAPNIDDGGDGDPSGA